MTSRRPRDLFLRALLLGLGTLALGLGHAAGQVEPEPEGAPIPPPEGEPVEGNVGLELALYGDLAVRPGRPLVLSGTAFETRGFGTLRRTPGLTVSAELRVATTEREERYVPLAGGSVRVRAATDGTFELTVPVPAVLGARPHVVVRVENTSGVRRGFGFPLSVVAPWTALVRADRVGKEGGTKFGLGQPIAMDGVSITIDLERLVERPSEIVRYRVAQYVGSYKGNHEHRRLSHAEKDIYFYPANRTETR